MAKPFKVLFIYPNTMMATLLPINISILSAALKKEGVDVRLFDTTYYPTEEINFEQKKVQLLQLKPYDIKSSGILFKKTDIHDDLKSAIDGYHPDLVAVTVVEDTYPLACELLGSVKSISSVPVVAGGVFAYAGAEMLIGNPNIDMVCVGEGEEAIVELCRKMAEGGDCSEILNLWVKRDGEVIINQMRPPVDLESLPYPDFDIFEPSRLGRPMHGKVFRMLHVELDRGCPYQCTYCEAPAIAGKYKQECDAHYYRRKSADRILAEIKFLKDKYRPDYINFNSESFLAKPIHELESIAKRYIQEIGLPFWCQSRPETVTREKLDILKDMGCSDLQYGIEHGNEAFRRKMLNRQVTNERMLESCLMTEQVKIPYTVNNIIGFPDETRELVWDTINFNRQINPKTMNCYFFTPYRGTWLYQYCVDNGLLDTNAKTMQLLDGGDIRYRYISREGLKGLQRCFSLYARMDEELFPKIRIAENLDETGDKMFNELALIFRRRFYGVEG